MLPQSPGVDPATCIPELVRCVEEYGNVAINLNPDPSGGHWNAPPLSDRHWYPIYEKMIEYDVPAMIHVSTSCNACFHTTGAHYLNADTTAFMQCLTADLFRDFPALRRSREHPCGRATQDLRSQRAARLSAPRRRAESERTLTMVELGVVYRTIERADRDIAARMGAFGAATVHEAMGRTGLLKPYI